MDVFLMIVYAVIILSILVFVHEGGHYLAARAFGVRVSEFMIGLPGPRVGFSWKGTRFGVTAIPLGGYARICGMESGEQSPYLKRTIDFVFSKGTVNMEDVAKEFEISDDDAYVALEQLSEWGTITGPNKKDKYNTYRAPAIKGKYELGETRSVDNLDEFFESEYKQQYRSLPFWKRSIILLAGSTVNLLFAVLVLVVALSFIGVDAYNPQTEEIVHNYTMPIWQSASMGFQFIAMTFSAIAGLFNPATAADTISQSSSLIGIAYSSQGAVSSGVWGISSFVAAISISLGLMNLLPIPPLDGGKFIIEIVQKISRKIVSPKVVNYISITGMLLFVGLFLVLATQDIQLISSGTFYDR